MSQTYQIPKEAAGGRLDVVLVSLTNQNRSQLQRRFKHKLIQIEGSPVTAKFQVKGGEQVELLEEPAQSLPAVPNLSILYQDDDIMAVDKPAGLVVHTPESGKLVPTVAAFAAQEGVVDDDIERPGIVHRLDKDTSGVLLIAKHPKAKAYLQDLFRHRRIKKTYMVLVRGQLTAGEATIRLPIDRSRKQPTKRAVVPGGREAITHYRVREQLPGASLVEVQLETGRTHQIRVHFAHLGHPVLGDDMYGVKLDKRLERQFLHASQVQLATMRGDNITITSPLPSDLADYLDWLRDEV